MQLIPIEKLFSNRGSIHKASEAFYWNKPEQWILINDLNFHGETF